MADAGFTRESDGAQRSYGVGPSGLRRLVGFSEIEEMSRRDEKMCAALTWCVAQFVDGMRLAIGDGREVTLVQAHEKVRAKSRHRTSC